MVIYLGNKKPVKVYKGTTELGAIYLGNNVIYQPSDESDESDSDTPILGPEPNNGDKLLVLNFENDSLTFNGLTPTSSGGSNDSSTVKFGSYSRHLDSYHNYSTLGQQKIIYDIPTNYLGRAWTLEFWFYLENYNSSTSIMAIEFDDLTDSEYNFGFPIRSSGSSFYINSEYLSYITSVTTAVKNWHHMAVTYDPQVGFNAWVNGTKVYSWNGHNFLKNSHSYKLQIFTYNYHTGYIDALNMEYGVKYSGSTITVPSTAPAETPTFTPSGTYIDTTETHTITYTSEYDATLNNVSLPITISTTESTLVDSILPTPIYSGSDTEHSYTFNGWKLNNTIVSNKDAILSDITLSADWTVKSASSTGIYIMGDINNWQPDSNYEFSWDSQNNCYKIENIDLAGSWKIADDYFTNVDWGGDGYSQVISGEPYYMQPHGSNMYFDSYVHINQMLFNGDTGELIVYF